MIPSAVVPPADATAIAHQASTGADMPTSPTLRAGTFGAEGVQLPQGPPSAAIGQSDSQGVLPHPAAGLIDAAISLSDGLKNGIDATTRVRIPARPAPTNDAITIDARNNGSRYLNVATAPVYGNNVTPHQLATTQTQTHPNFAVGEQIRTAFANLGAVVRKLAGCRITPRRGHRSTRN